jgi:phage-related protein
MSLQILPLHCKIDIDSIQMSLLNLGTRGVYDEGTEEVKRAGYNNRQRKFTLKYIQLLPEERTTVINFLNLHRATRPFIYPYVLSDSVVTVVPNSISEIYRKGYFQISLTLLEFFG